MPAPQPTPEPTLEARVVQAAAWLRERYGIPPRGEGGPVLDGLLGTILSQNTTGVTARQAFAALRQRYPHWEDLPTADPEDIADTIRIAGLADTRARRMQTIITHVIADFGEASLETLRDWSDDEVERYLTGLPGVGPKTAACVLLFAMRRDVFPVDTHVWRLARRLGWVPATADRNEAFRRLREVVPAPLRHELHVNLIRHGRTVCKAHQTACDQCPLATVCPSAYRPIT